MRRSRFSVEQIVAALKQAELGMAVAEVTRRLGSTIALNIGRLE